MKREEVLKKVDHTLLAQGAIWEQIKAICDIAEPFASFYDEEQVI